MWKKGGSRRYRKGYRPLRNDQKSAEPCASLKMYARMPTFREEGEASGRGQGKKGNRQHGILQECSVAAKQIRICSAPERKSKKVVPASTALRTTACCQEPLKVHFCPLIHVPKQ